MFFALLTTAYLMSSYKVAAWNVALGLDELLNGASSFHPNSNYQGINDIISSGKSALQSLVTQINDPTSSLSKIIAFSISASITDSGITSDKDTLNAFYSAKSAN